MRILPDHEKLQYSGRIDWTDRKAPVFVFPCTFVRMRFTGEMLKIYVKNKKSIFCQRKREPGQIKKDIVAGRGIYIYVGK